MSLTDDRGHDLSLTSFQYLQQQSNAAKTNEASVDHLKLHAEPTLEIKTFIKSKEKNIIQAFVIIHQKRDQI